MLERFSREFLGLDRVDPVVGGEARRVYLDTTATALMPTEVWRGVEGYLRAASANSHTDAHRAGRDTTRAIEASREAIGRLVGYQPGKDVVLFTANGATGAINFLARALFPPELRAVIKRFPGGAPEAFVKTLRDSLSEVGQTALDEMVDRPLVVTSVMEHHSNLLPWIEAVGHHNIRAVEVDPDDGTLRMDQLREILAKEGNRVRLVAITGVSNVTGIINPVGEIARMAHEVGAEMMVDGAQWVPHAQVRMHNPAQPDACIDYLVLSGHKMYAPGSRGALIGRLSTIACRPCIADVGGGMVGYVSIDDFSLAEEVTAREEAGTPNIPGTIAMGLAATLMLECGMEAIEHAEEELARYLVDSLSAIDGVTIYGATDLERVPRAGVVAFNVDGVDHGLVACYLDNFHNIAVRDGCFCAHPYIARLLRIDPETEQKVREALTCGDKRQVPGMVRASLGVYSTRADIDALCAALRELMADRDGLADRYEVQLDGTYALKGQQPAPVTYSLR